MQKITDMYKTNTVIFAYPCEEDEKILGIELAKDFCRRNNLTPDDVRIGTIYKEKEKINLEMVIVKVK